MRGEAVALLVAGFLLGAPPGEREARAARDAVEATLPNGTLEKLRARDAPTLRGALDDVRLAGKAAASAAPAIAKRLDEGLPLELAAAAIDTLGDLEVEATSPSLSRYLAHRTVALRLSAAKALGRTRGAQAVQALERALSDADGEVRGAAATALAAARATGALPELFVALDHRVNEAAAAIGQLCGPQECERLTSELGKLPFEVVTSGLSRVLFRPATEVSDEAKIKIIGNVRELGTPEANKFLREVQARWSTAPSATKAGVARVKQAIDQGVTATGGKPPTEGGEL